MKNFEKKAEEVLGKNWKTILIVGLFVIGALINTISV